MIVKQIFQLVMGITGSDSQGNGRGRTEGRILTDMVWEEGEEDTHRYQGEGHCRWRTEMLGVFEDEERGPPRWRGIGRIESEEEFRGMVGWTPWVPSSGLRFQPGIKKGSPGALQAEKGHH